MADIRINALANTASSSASDDFLALDGTTNGTRKLNAYSPSFGGNATVGGTLKVSGGQTTITNSDDGRVAPTGSVLVTNGNYGSTSTMGKLILSGGGGNNSTQSGWYIGSQNTAGVGGPAPYLGIGLATTDTGSSYGTFTEQLRLTSTGATLAGNLTVSGTGTSSVAGTLNIGSTGVSGYIRVRRPSDGGTNGYIGYADSDSADGPLVMMDANGNGQVKLNAYASTGIITFFTNNTERGRINSSGNLLLKSDGVDGGQKLQVAGTAYVSSTLTVGGDFYTSSFGSTWGADSGATGFQVWGVSGGADAYKVKIRTNGTTALTLDSSQRIICEGALRLNNAYVAGAPTATGYVTLQDSAGNTYKVLVGT